MGVLLGIDHEAPLRSLGEFRMVIDLGANRGQFSLVAGKIFPTAFINAFEALPEPAEAFRNLFARDNRVTLHPYAIGRERGKEIIHVSFDDDSSSLLPIGKSQVKLFPRTGEKDVRKVSVLPLTDALDSEDITPPALLKIDAQGYELEVLRGKRASSGSILLCVC